MRDFLRTCALLLAVALVPIGAAAAAAPDTRLVDAMARQDKAAARTLMKQGVDVNAASADGTLRVWDLDSGRVLTILEGV